MQGETRPLRQCVKARQNRLPRLNCTATFPPAQCPPLPRLPSFCTDTKTGARCFLTASTASSR
jgi:hypothetical protein